MSIFISTAEQCGADELCLNCHEVRSLAPGTTDAVKLGRFFDKVIERKYYPRGDTFGNEKRKYTNPSAYGAMYGQNIANFNNVI